jgi:hypothetical protein
MAQECQVLFTSEIIELHEWFRMAGHIVYEFYSGGGLPVGRMPPGHWACDTHVSNCSINISFPKNKTTQSNYA